MPTMHVQLDVKFRAFGVTFGNVHFQKDIPLPVEAEFVAHNQTLVGLNQNGVSLQITLKP